MIKILRVITRLNIGGPAIHTILLSSELDKDGYRDVLVCGKVSDSEGDMSYLAKEKGLEPVIMPELGRDISFGKDFRTFMSLYSIIRKERPDIIHTHTAKAGTLGRLAAILAGVPVKVHTFHGHIFDGYFSPFKAKVFILIEKILALFTDKVITVSDRVKDDIVNRLKITSNAKSVVIPLGLELEKFLNCENRKGEFRRKLGLKSDAMLIGIVGRLVPIKNHKMFLDAAKKVLDKRPQTNVEFVIVGDGESGDSLKEYARRLGIEKHVIFTGWVGDLSSVYADLDIVALTSLNEGTPVSVIEALASARPVIATDVGGVADVVSDRKNGLIARSDDAADFAGKVMALMDDAEERSRLGLCGRRDVMEKYSSGRLVRDIKKLYEECLAKNRNGR